MNLQRCLISLLLVSITACSLEPKSDISRHSNPRESFTDSRIAIGYSARQAVRKATEVARTWSPDAALCYVRTILPNPDGTEQPDACWDIEFLSETISRNYFIQIGAECQDRGERLRFVRRAKIPDDWLDSDMVLSNILDRYGDQISITALLSIELIGAENEQDDPQWHIVFQGREADENYLRQILITLNANSGDVLQYIRY